MTFNNKKDAEEYINEENDKIRKAPIKNMILLKVQMKLQFV